MSRSNRRHAIEFPMNVDLPADLAKELDDFIEATGMKKKACVELALRRFLKAEKKK